MNEQLDGLSMDLENTNKEKLKQVFPECFTEGKLDIDKLLSLCGEYMTDDYERYEFKWKGKSECLQLAQRRSVGTLRPCMEESVNWEDTKNLYIEGDNLEVLKLLQRTYYHKVKMIYIDPPYNTGNDFVYEDDFKDPLERYKEVTSQTTKSNPETMGRFHTNWLNMMYPRLRLAANLLREDGVCFISIDDNEVDNLKKICNETFGEENFVECITWNKRVPKNDKNIGNIHEYILIYLKSSANFKEQFTMEKDGISDIQELLDTLKKKSVPLKEAEKELKKLYDKKGYDRGITLYNSLDDEYEPWGKINMSWPNANTFGPTYSILHPVTQKAVKIPDRGWRWTEETFRSQLDYDQITKLHDGSYRCGNIWFANDENTQPSSIKYLRDVSRLLLRSVLSLKSDGGIEIEKIFDGKSFFSYPKPTSVLNVLLNSIENKNDIIMDFFSGSATTAHAVMQLNAEDGGNRQFIMVQLPEVCDEKTEAYKAGYKNICEIGKERIRRAGKKILEEWREKQKQISLVELKAEEEPKGEEKPTPPDIGFRVFKLDTSNCKVWDNSPVSEDNLTPLEERLKNMTTRVKPGRTDLDMVFEIMLKLGIPLTDQVIPMDIGGKRAYSIWENCLVLVCLERDVTLKQLEEMADYAPAQMVFAQDSFDGSVGKVNAEMTLQRYGIELKFL